MSNSMKRLLPIVVMIVMTLSGMANSMLDDYRYNVTFLDMQAGLPHNFVNSVYEDSRGFIWVATYGGGLVRYDGYVFSKTFPSDNMLMHSNSCRNVVEDRHGRLWVVFDEGVSVISLDTYRSVGKESFGIDIDKILHQDAVKVIRDLRNNIWLLAGKKAYKFVFEESGKIKNIYSVAFASNTPDIAIADVDGDGDVWAAIDDGIYKLKVERGKLVKHPVNKLAPLFGKAYFTDFMLHDGDIWVSSNIGLFRYYTDTRQIKRYTHDANDASSLTHDFTTCLAVGPTGNLIVGSLGGANFYKYNDDSFAHLRCDREYEGIRLSSNFIHCIYVHDGNVWVGTDNGGITKFSLRQLNLDNIVHAPDEASSLSDGCVNATYVEPNGTLWVGTVDGGLNRRAAGGKAFTHFTTSNSQLAHNSVSTLTANGRILWIGTWGGGVYWLDMDNPDRLYRLEVQPQYARLILHIGALAYDNHNKGLWIGSNDGIFFFDSRSGQLQMPFDGCDLVRGCIGSLIDTQQRLWIGCMTGMRVVDLRSRRKGKFACESYMYKLDNPDSKLIDKITCFCQTRDGNIYIGSNGNGIYRLTGVSNGRMTFKTYTTQDGLANNGVKGIVEGSYGRIWIATNNGLSVMNPKDDAFSNYGEVDGLLCSKFYWNAAVCQGNKIYLGSEKGLTAINVDEMATRAANKVILTNLNVDNTPILSVSRFIDSDISVAKRITLHESDKSFELFFSTLRYDDDGRSVFCYRMKEFEKEWIQTRAGEHSVRYTNLPPGKYTFEVKCLSALSDDEGNVSSVEVVVRPYFYKTWWFMLIVIVAVAFIARRIYQQRVEKLKREEGERMLKPIRSALESAENPMELQERIRTILENHRHFRRSTARSVEIDQEKEREHIHNFMDDLFKAMEDGYMDSGFDIEQLAESMRMSRSALSKKLKEETGQTVSQLLKDYRLNIARDILVKNSGNRNITEIAYRVGFNDPKKFTRCITKKYGISPSGYLDSVDKNSGN